MKIVGSLPLFILIALFVSGCSVPRVSNTARTAVEQQLLSTVIERCIRLADFSDYRGKKVYMDYTYLDTQTDKIYIQGFLQHYLAEQGIQYVSDIDTSEYIIQPTSGVLATDQRRILIGTPPLPIPLPELGISLVVPEVALFSKQTRVAYARFSFNIMRTEGRVPDRSITGINTSAEYCDWIILLYPFVSHNLPHPDPYEVPHDFFFTAYW